MPQQLEELVCRYLDGQADTEEVRRLDRAVQSDRQVARMLVEMAALESRLGQMLSLERTAAEISTDQSAVTPTAESPLAARTKEARRQQRRWRAIGIATAVAAVAAVVALMVYNAVRLAPSPSPTGSPLVAEVVEIYGMVERVPDSTGAPGQLSLSDSLEPGDKLRLANVPGTRLTLKYPDGTTVTFFQNAAGALIHGGAKRVQLDTGELLADITPQPENREMTFVTRDAEAKVLGTRLRLKALPNSSVLDVARGQVEFKRISDPTTAMVSAGQRIESRAGLRLLPRSVPPRSTPMPLPPEIDKLPGLAHDGQNLWLSNGRRIYRINAFDGTLDESATLDLGEISGFQGADGLAWDGTSLWVADKLGSKILRIHPVTGTVQDQFSTMDTEAEGPARSRQIWDIAVAGGYVWGVGYGNLEQGGRGPIVFRINRDGEVDGQFEAPEDFTYYAITHHEGNLCLHGVGPDRSGRIFIYPNVPRDVGPLPHDLEPIEVFYGAKASRMVTGLCSDRAGRLWLVNAGVHDRAGIHTSADERWIQSIEFTDLQEVKQP